MVCWVSQGCEGSLLLQRGREAIPTPAPTPWFHGCGFGGGALSQTWGSHLPSPLQDTGELCLQSAQCKSGCCQRDSGLSLARCVPKAAELQDCSPKVGA